MTEINQDIELGIPDQPWALDEGRVLESLKVDPDQGLSTQQVHERRKRFGYNRLRQAERKSAWEILLDQFRNLIVALLVAAAVISFVFGEQVEALAIVAVVLLNAAIGFFTELRAVRSMEALRELSSVEAKTRRMGSPVRVDAQDLVPGDVVLLESGDIVTADVRLVQASKLQADESALTGESVPVDKGTEPVQGGTPMAERSSMVYKGTSITRGAGEGVVVATGMNTELGEISALVEEAEEEVTPLEKRLDRLGENLAWVTLGIAAALAVIGIVGGRDVILILETAIALAVAAVPEGLPIVATIALARGMHRMAQKNAIINRLSAVETLGATTVICADKTGTLTENQMGVHEVRYDGHRAKLTDPDQEVRGKFLEGGELVSIQEDEHLRRVLETAALCNNAKLKDGSEEGALGGIGDPLEIALLQAADQIGIRREDLLEAHPEAREVAFDPEVKMMATVHKMQEGYQVAVKGAAEAVLNASTELYRPQGNQRFGSDQVQQWMDRSNRMAQGGLRVIAVASKLVDNPEVEPYRDLQFLGLVGLLDPPREEVRHSLRRCKGAGIRVVMVTGDQPMTARKIAQAVDLVEEEEPEIILGDELDSLAQEGGNGKGLESRIFARVTPKQKLNLIEAYQDQGEIVAMTGDGVNDAPALKTADIGIAMGLRGTQVAQEAAAMVLKDDAFDTIVLAVEQGRAIFNNIRKFVVYLLSCNVSEIMVVSLASLSSAPLPIKPLQILFLNLVTDVFPALALGIGEADPAIMERRPRNPAEPIITRNHWLTISGYSALITVAVLSAFWIALNPLAMEVGEAVTVSFLTLASAQLWHVFNMRTLESNLIRNEVTTNPAIWGALLLCVGLLLIAVYVPGLSRILGTTRLDPMGWALVLTSSLFPLLAAQLLKILGWGEV